MSSPSQRASWSCCISCWIETCLQFKFLCFIAAILVLNRGVFSDRSYKLTWVPSYMVILQANHARQMKELQEGQEAVEAERVRLASVVEELKSKRAELVAQVCWL